VVWRALECGRLPSPPTCVPWHLHIDFEKHILMQFVGFTGHQIKDTNRSRRMYSGFIDCARKTIATDGASALWRRFWPSMGRVRTPSPSPTFHPEVVDESLEWTGVPCKCRNVPRCRVFAHVARHAYLIRIAVHVQYILFTDIYRSSREPMVTSSPINRYNCWFTN